MGCSASKGVAIQTRLQVEQTNNIPLNAPPPPNVSTPDETRHTPVPNASRSATPCSERGSVTRAQALPDDNTPNQASGTVNSPDMCYQAVANQPDKDLPATSLQQPASHTRAAVTSLRASAMIQHLQQTLGFVTSCSLQGELLHPRIDPFSVRLPLDPCLPIPQTHGMALATHAGKRS